MNTKRCNHCFEELPASQFYKKGNGLWAYCKSCESIRKKQQLVNFKKQCLGYKQQFSCTKCGYDHNIVALDFHHTDPTQKDFNISKCRNLVLNDRIKAELDKCVVICSNCHREEHSLECGLFTPKILKPRSPSLCTECGSECSHGVQRCKSCYIKEQKKNIPSREDLILDIKSLKYATSIANKYKVTGNAVKKWMKGYKLFDFYKSNKSARYH